MRSQTFILAMVVAAASAVIAVAGASRAASLPRQAQAPPATPATPEKKADQAPAVPKEKTAAEAFKNIQVLKDIPASQLMPAMFMMSASLGVGCDFCHVTSDTGSWPMEKDDKKPKQTAREMVKMLYGINDGTFGGRTDVSCASCHQGHTSTTPLPPIAPLGAKHDDAKPDAAKDMPTADSLLDRYVEALGGAVALDKLKTRESTGTFVGESGKIYPVDMVQKAPASFVMTLGGDSILAASGYDGESAWEQRGPQAFVQTSIMAGRVSRLGDFWVGAEAKKLYPRRTVTGVEEVNGEEAYVVRAGGPGEISERLYFSKASGLLLRRVVLTKTPLGRMPMQADYSDYREVDGAKVPFTIERLELNSRFTIKFTEIKFNVPVNDQAFAVPVGPQ
ncbi:MAG TPA: c-type cytochrome [Candidatus Acidoferrales bacterium]|nr:c-type cytochrome [Candidatus Acidoferrales bacterium]